jgi:histidinol phosphatase-like PHP family hydrolase
MILKGQLHIHTTCSDGELSPQETADLYSDLGMDFIAFTDHDYLIRHDYERVTKEVRSKMLVFHGVELTVFERGYFHISRIFGNREIIHVFNHPADYGLGVKQLVERMCLLSKKNAIDAVEITMNGFYTARYDVPEIAYPKIATDDSHGRAGCCRTWIEVESRRNKDCILRAIKNGDFQNYYWRENP